MFIQCCNIWYNVIINFIQVFILSNKYRLFYFDMFQYLLFNLIMHYKGQGMYIHSLYINFITKYETEGKI